MSRTPAVYDWSVYPVLVFNRQVWGKLSFKISSTWPAMLRLLRTKTTFKDPNILVRLGRKSLWGGGGEVLYQCQRAPVCQKGHCFQDYWRGNCPFAPPLLSADFHRLLPHVNTAYIIIRILSHKAAIYNPTSLMDVIMHGDAPHEQKPNKSQEILATWLYTVLCQAGSGLE